LLLLAARHASCEVAFSSSCLARTSICFRSATREVARAICLKVRSLSRWPVQPPPWTDANVSMVRCKVTANDNITLPGKRRPLAQTTERSTFPQQEARIPGNLRRRSHAARRQMGRPKRTALGQRSRQDLGVEMKGVYCRCPPPGDHRRGGSVLKGMQLSASLWHFALCRVGPPHTASTSIPARQVGTLSSAPQARGSGSLRVGILLCRAGPPTSLPRSAALSLEPSQGDYRGSGSLTIPPSCPRTSWRRPAVSASRGIDFTPSLSAILANFEIWVGVCSLSFAFSAACTGGA